MLSIIITVILFIALVLSGVVMLMFFAVKDLDERFDAYSVHQNQD